MENIQHFKTWNFFTSIYFCESFLPFFVRIRIQPIKVNADQNLNSQHWLWRSVFILYSTCYACTTFRWEVSWKPWIESDAMPRKALRLVKLCLKQNIKQCCGSHRFDTDLDSTFHFDLSRFESGFYPKWYTCRKVWKIFWLLVTEVPVHICVICRCHNIQYFGQCIKIFGKKFSLASLLVEMVPDPAKWCRSGRIRIHNRTPPLNSSKKPEYLFKIFENTTLGWLFYTEGSRESLPFKTSPLSN